MERKSFRVMEEESGRNECLKQKCWHWASGDLVVVTSGEVGERCHAPGFLQRGVPWLPIQFARTPSPVGPFQLVWGGRS